MINQLAAELLICVRGLRVSTLQMHVKSRSETKHTFLVNLFAIGAIMARLHKRNPVEATTFSFPNFRVSCRL